MRSDDVSAQRNVRFDCAHYQGSRPCAPHKHHGVTCAACEYYEPVRERVLIVKLGAMGDVLRTTALIPDIRAAHPQGEITWMTLSESLPILRFVDGVDRIVDAKDAAVFLAARQFDVLYNFDNDDEAVALAAAARARQKRGFRIGSSGHCEGVHEGGDPRLFELGLWDDLKRRNTTSYLTMLAATAGVQYGGARPHLRLPGRAEESGDPAAARRCIGINTDAGTRWLRKQWNLPYVEQAVDAFVSKGYDVVLFGGEPLLPFNQMLARRFDSRVRAANTAGDFEALCREIASVDVLVTGDTLAMHVAWALGVPLVTLFGPTSAAEIDIGPQDVKLFAGDLDCLGCYLHTCEVTPHCMDRLTPELVVGAVDSRIHAALETS